MTDDEWIDRRRAALHNRKTLGYSYYETRTGRDRPTTTKQRVNKSRAGQANWRHRPMQPSFQDDELTRLALCLTIAHATLDIIDARRPT